MLKDSLPTCSSMGVLSGFLGGRDWQTKEMWGRVTSPQLPQPVPVLCRLCTEAQGGKVPVQGRTCPFWGTFSEVAEEVEEGASALQHTSLARRLKEAPGTGWPEPVVGRGLQGQVLLGFVLNSSLPLDLQTLGQTWPKLVSHWGLAHGGFDPHDPTGNAVLFWPY